MSSNSPPTHQASPIHGPDRLSALSPELLRKIFCIIHDESSEPMLGAISKGLLPFTQTSLYHTVRFKSYASLALFCRTIRENEALGALVHVFKINFSKEEENWVETRMVVNFPAVRGRHLGVVGAVAQGAAGVGTPVTVRQRAAPVYGPNAASVSDDDLLRLFDELARVRKAEIKSVRCTALLLSDRYAPTCFPALEELSLDVSFADLAYGSIAHVLKHPFLETLIVEVPGDRPLRSEATGGSSEEGASAGDQSADDGSETLDRLVHSIRNLSVSGPGCATSPEVINFVSYFRNLRSIDFTDLAVPPTLDLNPLLLAIPSSILALRVYHTCGRSQDDPVVPAIDNTLLRFTQLESLVIANADIGSRFCESIRQLPLRHLAFGRLSPDARELIALVSGPRKHCTLRSLDLSNVRGKIGGDPSDEALLGPDPRGELFKAGWTLPHWTALFPEGKAVKLVEAAKAEGVHIGGSLIDALDTMAEYNEQYGRALARRDWLIQGRGDSGEGGGDQEAEDGGSEAEEEAEDESPAQAQA